MKLILTSVKAEEHFSTEKLVEWIKKLGYTYNLKSSTIEGRKMDRPIIDLKNINEFFLLSKKVKEPLILKHDDGGNPVVMIYNSWIE